MCLVPTGRTILVERPIQEAFDGLCIYSTYTRTLQGVSNELPHTTYRLPDRAPLGGSWYELRVRPSPETWWKFCLEPAIRRLKDPGVVGFMVFNVAAGFNNSLSFLMYVMLTNLLHQSRAMENTAKKLHVADLKSLTERGISLESFVSTHVPHGPHPSPSRYGGLLEAFRYALDLDGSGTCRKPVLETGQHMAPQIVRAYLSHGSRCRPSWPKRCKGSHVKKTSSHRCHRFWQPFDPLSIIHFHAQVCECVACLC